MASTTTSALPSMEVKPHQTYPGFFKALYLMARNQGTAFLPANGCIHFILPDDMWWALPGNTAFVQGVPGVPGIAAIPAGGGNPAVPAIPAIAQIPDIPATPRPMTTLEAINPGANQQGQRDLVRANNLQHVELTTVQQNLRAAILTAIGPIIQARLVTDEVTGNIDRDTWDIIDLLREWYGTLSPADVNDLLSHLEQPIADDEADTFIAFYQHFRQLAAQVDNAGAPLSEFYKLQKLTTACAAQPYIMEAIKDYNNANPLIANQHIAGAAAFITQRLNNKPAGGTSQSQGYWATPVAPKPPQRTEGGRHNTPTGKGTGGKGRGAGGGGRGPSQGPYYCYLHGTNTTHPGYINDTFCCRSMTPDTTTGLTQSGHTYSMAQRTARHAKDVPEGTQTGKA